MKLMYTSINTNAYLYMYWVYNFSSLSHQVRIDNQKILQYVCN